jgi:hypothetical protein
LSLGNLQVQVREYIFDDELSGALKQTQLPVPRTNLTDCSREIISIVDDFLSPTSPTDSLVLGITHTVHQRCHSTTVETRRLEEMIARRKFEMHEVCICYFEEIDNRESISSICTYVLHSKVEPLRIPFGVEIIAKIEFVFEFTATIKRSSFTRRLSLDLTLVLLSSDFHFRNEIRKEASYPQDCVVSLQLVDNLPCCHRYEIE